MKRAGGVAVLAFLLAACAAPSSPPAPSGSTAPVTSPTPSPAVTSWVVYFARDLADPIRVSLDGPAPATTAVARVRQRIEILVGGPRVLEGGAFNTLPGMKARLATAAVAGDLATLDYAVPSDDWGLNGSVTLRGFVQQVIYTASEEPGVVRVLLTQNGGRQAIIGGEGLVISGAQTRASISQHLDLMPLQAARLIRMTTTGARPLLIVTGIPDDWTAQVSANVDTFAVTYTDPSQTKRVSFSIAIADLPLPRSDSTQAWPRFHGDGAARYQVASAPNPRSERWLTWTEAGSWSVPGAAGVPYLFSTTGLTELEFWRLADSIHPNQI